MRREGVEEGDTETEEEGGREPSAVRVPPTAPPTVLILPTAVLMPAVLKVLKA